MVLVARLADRGSVSRRNRVRARVGNLTRWDDRAVGARERGGSIRGAAAMKVGVIGLGTMGAPMAANLLKKGFEVHVHNRTRDREKTLAEQGARRAESPAALAKEVD